jgi:hypothetical protein
MFLLDYFFVIEVQTRDCGFVSTLKTAENDWVKEA